MDKRLGLKEYRIEHLYKIRNKQQKVIPFRKNRAQTELDKKAAKRNIILKSRQLGMTTFEAVDMLDDTLFTRNFNGLLIAQDLDTAKDIFSNKIEFAWNNFPLQELYKVDNQSARQLKFDFGDKSFSSIIVDSSGRSGTFNRLHITEFALVCARFPDRAREVLEGSIPAVPLNGRVDIESTAQGEQGDFHNMFWEAWERGEPAIPSEYKAHFFNWTYDDEEISLIGRVEKVPKEFEEIQKKYKLSGQQITYYYYKWLALNKNWDSLLKEYPSTPEEAFRYSGNKLFNVERVMEMKKSVQEGERFGDWTFFDKSLAGHRYVIAADPAEGVGQDSSAAVIWDFTPVRPRVVAQYHSNRIPPDLFAYEIKNGGEKYQMAYAAVERNATGFATLSKLKEIYPERNIYKDEHDKYGWQTNTATKPKMFYDLSTAVNDDLAEIPSMKILNEAQVYDKEELQSAKFDPEATQHFDLLTACAIGFQMKDQWEETNVTRQFKPILKRY